MQEFNIEIFSRKPMFRRRQHYFRFVSCANGQTIASSEGYFNESDMLQTLKGIKQNAASARVIYVPGDRG